MKKNFTESRAWKKSMIYKADIIEAILFRLRTGCQWRQLSVEKLFRKKNNWQSTYHHFPK